MMNASPVAGFVDRKVGSIHVRVPLRQIPEPSLDTPLASFEMEGDAYAILVRRPDRSKEMMDAVHAAAEEALVRLSRKLLN